MDKPSTCGIVMQTVYPRPFDRDRRGIWNKRHSKVRTMDKRRNPTVHPGGSAMPIPCQRFFPGLSFLLCSRLWPTSGKVFSPPSYPRQVSGPLWARRPTCAASSGCSAWPALSRGTASFLYFSHAHWKMLFRMTPSSGGWVSPTKKDPQPHPAP